MLQHLFRLLMLFVAAAAQCQNDDWQKNYDHVFAAKEGMHRVIKAGRYGYVDTAGALQVSCTYPYLGDFEQGAAAFIQDKKLGYLRRKANGWLPAIFEEAQALGAYKVVSSEGKKGLLDPAGRLVLACEYERLHGAGEGYFAAYSKEGQVIIFDSTGTKAFALAAGQDYHHRFKEGHIAIRTIGKGVGVYDKQGLELIPPVYQDLYPIGDGLFAAKKTGLFGIINIKNETRAPFHFSEVGELCDGLALVRRNGFYGYINRLAQPVMPCKLDKAQPFVAGEAVVQRNDILCVIDTTGDIVRQLPYTAARAMNAELYELQQGRKYGLMNRKGGWVLACEYDAPIDLLESGNVVVRKGGRSGVLALDGRVIIPIQYSEIIFYLNEEIAWARTGSRWEICNVVLGQWKAASFNNSSPNMGFFVGYNRVWSGSQYGYANSLGDLLIDCQYQDAAEFSGGLAAVKKDYYWGYINTQNQKVIDFKLEAAESFRQGYAVATTNRKKGLLDEAGEWAIAPEYDALYWRNRNNIEAKKDDKEGVLNCRGGVVIPMDNWALDYYPFMDVYKVYKQAVWGLANSQGELLIKPKYRHLSINEQGRLLVAQYKDKNGLINMYDSIVIPFEYNKLEVCYGENLVIAEKNKLHGGFALDGSLRLNFEYEQLRSPTENLILARKNGLLGCMNTRGQLLVDYTHKGLKVVSGGLFQVQNERNKWGCINIKGEVLIPTEYDYIRYRPESQSFWVQHNGRWGIYKEGLGANMRYEGVEHPNDDLVIVAENNLYGVLDAYGQPIVPTKYHYIIESTHFEDDPYFNVEMGDLWGVMSLEGKLLVPCEYQERLEFEHGVAIAKISDKYGVIDINNRKIIPIIYDAAVVNNEKDPIWLAKDGRWGAVDWTGKVVVPFQYNHVPLITFLNIKDGQCIMQKGNKYGVVGLRGEPIIPFEYEALDFDFYNRFRAKKGGKWGIVDIHNKLVMNFLYDEIDVFVNGFVAVKQGELWGYINERGDLVLPCVYERAEPFNSFGRASVRLNGRNIYINTLGEED